MAKSPKKSKIDDISLESVMMNCRNALRGKVGGNEKNRDTVMGLVFLKFVGDKFAARRAEIMAQYPEIFWDKESFYRSENVFYLPEHSRWQYLVENASADDIAVKIDAAMKEIEERNPPLKGALPQNFYSGLGLKNKEIKSLIDEISKLDNQRFHEPDLIGRVQEYFLQVFAIDSGAGVEKGEFYTPSSIVELIAELIEPYSGTVYDPCCGTGGMFVQSMKFVENHQGNRKNISIIGQESNPDTWRLAKMNLALRGIAHDLGESSESTFLHDQHPDRKVDYIMANPPFNLKNWREADQLTDDARWEGYTVPPKSNANYAWILHMLNKLDETHGIAGFLLANGALSAISGEAHAQNVDFNASSPQIEQIKARMASRFGELRPFLDSGAVGLTGDGLVAVHDANAASMAERARMNQLVNAENKDRKALYQAIADANNQPGWAGQIQKTFAERWISQAQSGWWYQSGGSWKKK